MVQQTPPVTDWTSDFDVMDPGYVEDPFPIWDELRKTCPVARTERRTGAWLLTTYADVTAAAHDIEHFSLARGWCDRQRPGRRRRAQRDPLRAPAHLRGPAAAHLDPTAPSPLVLAREGRDVRGDDARPVQPPDRRLRGARPRRRGGRLRPADPRPGDRTGPRRARRHVGLVHRVVRDLLEFADDPERVARGQEGLGTYLIAEIASRRAAPGEDLINESSASPTTASRSRTG